MVSWNKFLLCYILIIFFFNSSGSNLIFNCRFYEQEVSIKYYFSFFAISNSSEHDSHGCFSLVLISNSFSFWTATFNIRSSSQLTKEKRKRKRSCFLLILKANIPKKKKKRNSNPSKNKENTNTWWRPNREACHHMHNFYKEGRSDSVPAIALNSLNGKHVCTTKEHSSPPPFENHPSISHIHC
jgi:hypothetical protein